MSKRSRKKVDQPALEEEEEDEVLDTAPESTATQPKKIRIAHSHVHQEYEQKETVNKEKKLVIRSKCKHCVGPDPQIFPHKMSSELKRHLKYAHPDVYKKVELLDLKKKEEKAEQLAIPKSRNDQIQDCFNSWLVARGLPMDTSEDPRFKKFMAMVDDTVKIPGAKAQLNYSYKKYLILDQKIKDILSGSSHVHLTMDMWTSKSSTDAFIGITVHCWDNAAKVRRNFRLALRTFNERHTAANILDKVTKILEEYNIRAKVRTISTDNGANIKRQELLFLYPYVLIYNFFRAMADLMVLEEKDANANTPENYGTPFTDVCHALLNADEFTPSGCSVVDLDEEVIDVDQFLEDEETISDDLKDAVRTFDLSWLPCFAHLLQLPIVAGISKKVNFIFFMAALFCKFVATCYSCCYCKEGTFYIFLLWLPFIAC